MVCQRVGMRAPDFGDAPLFVYKKGLISPPSQRNAQIAIKELISPFKITTPSGTAHVPWYHFSWLPTREHRLLPANPDSLIECFNVFKNLTAQNVFVVWTHADNGAQSFEWYVAFLKNKTGRSYTLTRVPHQYFQTIIENSGINHARSCDCVWCRQHPLSNFLSTSETYSATAFETNAVKYFVALRSQIESLRREQRKKTNVPCTKSQGKAGTCCVCLDDVEVREDSCPHKTCKLSVCTDCNEKMRGLCPLCDREKKEATFFCMTCSDVFPVQEFGYACTRCKRPSVCQSCHQCFEMCISCVCDITSVSSRQSPRRKMLPE